MQNNVAVIEQYPKTLRAALRLGAHFGFFAQGILHVFRDGLDLCIRIAGANHKIIGKRRLAAHIKRLNVVGFDFVASATNQFQFLPAGSFELFSSFSDGISF